MTTRVRSCVRLGAALTATAVVAVYALWAAASSPASPNFYCPPQIVKLVDAVVEIQVAVVVGLSFKEYKALLKKATVAAIRVPRSQTGGRCGAYVAVPALRALTNYAKAYKVWARCIAELGSCTTGSVNALIQRHWANASVNVRRAVNNLDN